jgi:hypothetical protein
MRSGREVLRATRWDEEVRDATVLISFSFSAQRS